MKQMIFKMARYAVVGTSATFFDFGFYFVLTRWFGLGEVVSNVISYMLSTSWAFYWNRRWTFRSAGNPKHEYGRYWVISLVGLAISTSVVYLGLQIGIHDLIAKVAAILLSGLWNFFMHRHWTFKKGTVREG